MKLYYSHHLDMLMHKPILIKRKPITLNLFLTLSSESYPKLKQIEL
jgi:hypothetical protein